MQLKRIESLSPPAGRPAIRVARLAVLLASLAGLAGMTIAVSTGFTTSFDQASVATLTAWHGGPLDIVMRLVTDFGGGQELSIFTVTLIASLLAIRRYRSAVFVAVAFVAVDWASGALKAIVARPRPGLEYRTALELPGWFDLLWILLAAVLILALWRKAWRRVGLLAAVLFAVALVVDAEFGFRLSTPEVDAFPSGHAMRSMGLAASLVLVTWAHHRRTMLLITAALLVLLIGVSRVYLGVHYPTDVLAGWLAALVVVLGLSLIPPIDPTREMASSFDVSSASPGRQPATEPAT